MTLLDCKSMPPEELREQVVSRGIPAFRAAQLRTWLDAGATTETFDSIGPEGAPKTEREFYVTSKNAPFLYEGTYGTAERIWNLLVASLETGNPIRWC